MRAKVSFLARVKGSSGRFPFVEVPIKHQRPVPPKGATSFYVRFSLNGKRTIKPVGVDVDAAFVAYQNIELNHTRVLSGLLPTLPTSTEVESKQTGAPISFNDAIEKYLEDRRAVGNDEITVQIYSRTIRDFETVCAERGVTSLSQVSRDDLLAYLVWLRKNLRKQSHGSRDATLASRMRRLGTFLRKHGIKLRKDQSPTLDDKGLLDYNEVPKEPKKKPTKYGTRTLQALLDTAEKTHNEDALDLIQFLLCTGFRDEEVAYCEWSDINFREGTVNVSEKLRTADRPWEWRPKDKEERPHDIPLPPALLDRLKARKARMAAAHCALIFPTGVCKPDNNLLRRVREVAEAAGIEERITLHAFRRTFGSNMAKQYGIEVARQYLGHSDIATTQKYLAADTDETDAVKAGIGSLYTDFGVGTEGMRPAES